MCISHRLLRKSDITPESSPDRGAGGLGLVGGTASRPAKARHMGRAWPHNLTARFSNNNLMEEWVDGFVVNSTSVKRISICCGTTPQKMTCPPAPTDGQCSIRHRDRPGLSGSIAASRSCTQRTSLGLAARRKGYY
jgi:hypothetical protein